MNGASWLTLQNGKSPPRIDKETTIYIHVQVVDCQENTNPEICTNRMVCLANFEVFICNSDFRAWRYSPSYVKATATRGGYIYASCSRWCCSLLLYLYDVLSAKFMLPLLPMPPLTLLLICIAGNTDWVRAIYRRNEKHHRAQRNDACGQFGSASRKDVYVKA